MLNQSGCRPSDHPGMPRRHLLQVGGLGLIGAGMSDLAKLEACAAGGADRILGRAKSVVLIFQAGGPSQHETFDPKPESPSEIRGEYGTAQTGLPGVHFCEYLPKLAARTNLFSLVRTMHHTAERQFRNEHSSCFYLLHTGTTELPVGDTNASISTARAGRISWPNIGSMIAYAAPPPPAVGWPAVVEIPRINQMSYPGREPGMLGPRFSRWGVDLAPKCNAKDAGGSCPNCYSHDDPNDLARAPGTGPHAWWDNTSCRNPDFHLPDLGSGFAVSGAQIQHRSQLLRQLDGLRRAAEQGAVPRSSLEWDAHHEQALRLLNATRPGRQNPFDLTHETDATRDRYGREEWGQGFLVARRLIEAGVRMVQVNLRGWDTHQNAFRDLKGKLLPSIDHCLSGFLDDLSERGLLEQTLVVMCGEMGRTPRISPISPGGKNASGELFTPGRHHWGDVFPCLLAGGGIVSGRVIGATDAHGGVPITEAYTPADLAATIFQQLGIGPDCEFHDATGRPFRVYRGEPIRGLF
ncbi:DUF1501 domain-containing protein [Schlesneria paludicola]|uniref:DUF1501 domain-containing protein n=1 Tax=Schlesneria paludicola TaxID=360056 RepID=UPI00029AEF74|nr:DUF1501 domain-containing protein [Schlesneria paludicola]